MSHVEVNRDHWNATAEDWVALGERQWARDEPVWGLWATPDAEAPLLPEDMTGMDAVELGCGTGYVSAWMARRGATVTGIDIAERQLATARRLAKEHKAEITFIEGDAEVTGLSDQAFDFAVSEYGAAIWCDPEIWLREAFRLLRPGGRLSFLGCHPMMIVTAPMDGGISDRTLHRSYRQLSSVDWSDAEVEPGGIEFCRPISGYFALFHEIGFVVEDFRELYARPEHEGVWGAVTAEWAQEYPSEFVWWLRKP